MMMLIKDLLPRGPSLTWVLVHKYNLKFSQMGLHFASLLNN